MKHAGIADELVQMVREEGMGPLLEEMPRNSLADKMIAGPTAAHRIEEVHTPLNLAYITFSTGSSSFQNLVGVTFAEVPARVEAGRRMFELAGIEKGSRVVFCYPPLINLFTKEVFRQMQITPILLERPSRDALLAAVAKEQPDAVVGEGSFLAAAIRDAGKLGLLEIFPEHLILIAAGTPYPEELTEEAERIGAAPHDLYGCQEYGVLCLDGIPLREDLVLVEDTNAYYHLLVGGLPTGDLFQTGRHKLHNKIHAEEAEKQPANALQILTYTRKRAEYEPEILVTATTALNRETVVRTARGIIRLKGHVVRVAEDVICGAEATKLSVRTPESSADSTMELTGPVATGLFDELLQAQMDYQKYQKADPVWNKQGR